MDKYEKWAKELMKHHAPVAAVCYQGDCQSCHKVTSIAQALREAAAEAFREAEKIAENERDGWMDDNLVAWNSCDDIRLSIRARAAALARTEKK